MPHRPETVASAAQLPKKIKKVVLVAGTALALAGMALWLRNREPTPSSNRAAREEGFPLCTDAKDEELTFSRPTAQLQLQPNCWSGWVSLPNNVNFRVKKAEGSFYEYLFWNGARYHFTREERRWLGRVPSSNFRLRGDGTAEIWVSR